MRGEKMNYKVIIGKNLQNARKAFKKLTQTEMAKEMNTSQTVYARYERGQIELDYEKIVWLCERLDITPNDLFDGCFSHPLI